MKTFRCSLDGVRRMKKPVPRRRRKEEVGIRVRDSQRESWRVLELPDDASISTSVLSTSQWSVIDSGPSASPDALEVPAETADLSPLMPPLTPPTPPTPPMPPTPPTSTSLESQRNGEVDEAGAAAAAVVSSTVNNQLPLVPMGRQEPTIGIAYKEFFDAPWMGLNNPNLPRLTLRQANRKLIKIFATTAVVASIDTQHLIRKSCPWVECKGDVKEIWYDDELFKCTICDKVYIKFAYRFFAKIKLRDNTGFFYVTADSNMTSVLLDICPEQFSSMTDSEQKMKINAVLNKKFTFEIYSKDGTNYILTTIERVKKGQK